ncbi:hypothetical protein Ciccas_007187 [Cichlidogyrus casuarinus]|uniref:Uncharacterized protein n=1 Tax=Cichlidogyrus casuarinus TaxID=1844966 RepID=A0ABD2Q4Y0_9PLAT
MQMQKQFLVVVLLGLFVLSHTKKEEKKDDKVECAILNKKKLFDDCKNATLTALVAMDELLECAMIQVEEYHKCHDCPELNSMALHQNLVNLKLAVIAAPQQDIQKWRKNVQNGDSDSKKVLKFFKDKESENSILSFINRVHDIKDEVDKALKPGKRDLAEKCKEQDEAFSQYKKTDKDK